MNDWRLCERYPGVDGSEQKLLFVRLTAVGIGQADGARDAVPVVLNDDRLSIRPHTCDRLAECYTERVDIALLRVVSCQTIGALRAHVLLQLILIIVSSNDCVL